MKKELLCSFLFGLWNHFVLFFIMFCSFWFEPRFYIVEFDFFTNNFELYIFFYVFYQHNIGRKEKKPAIGVEPMTIALQMRCSNL